MKKNDMKENYNFGYGKRGAIDPWPPGKTRITIRLDDDIIEWFREQADAQGGGNYQTMINAALRNYIQSQQEPLEDIVRRVVSEELSNFK
jgi:uncharacterized protein (DUF4415 family)